MKTALVAGVCLVLLAGCGGAEPATTPTATPTATPTEEPTTTRAGLPDDYRVPDIADPLEPGVFLANPCSLLSVSQRAEVGLPVAEQSPGVDTCVLGTERNPARPVELQILEDSLVDLVDQCRADDTCATWTPTTVEEHPALLDTADACRLMVGLTDERTLVVNDLPESPCERAVTIAELSMEELRTGP